MAYFYHTEMLMVGVILLSAMTLGGVKLWLNRRQENLDLSESENLKKNSEQNSE